MDQSGSEFEPTQPSQNTDIPEELFIEKKTVNTMNNTESNELNIEQGFSYLLKFLEMNLEEDGYNDALRNPDSSNMEESIKAIKTKLDLVIKKTTTFYEDLIKSIDFHIESRSRSGLVDTVEELKMKKEIAESHIMKIRQIETDANNSTGESQGIILSYTKGFKNGLAAISHSTILQVKL